MAPNPSPPPLLLSLEGDLDVFSIQPQVEKLLALLPSGAGRVELDLAAVGDLDLSGIQMLHALERELAAKGIPLALTGARDEWRARFAPMGLARLFSAEAP